MNETKQTKKINPEDNTDIMDENNNV